MSRAEPRRPAPAARLPADAAWDAAAVVEQASALARAGERSGVPGHVVKQGRRSTVVWLDRGGPADEPVVVKSTRTRSLGRRLLARFLGSSAEQQRRGAVLLLDAGLPTAEPLAALDRPGSDGAPASHLIMRAITDGEPLDIALGRIEPRRRVRFARALGRFIARLHASGIYAPDLRDKNLLVTCRPDGRFDFALVDLDRVRRPIGGLSSRRRRANLVQLDRTLGWLAVERERLALLGAYRRALPAETARLGELAALLDVERREKDRAVARRRRRAGIVPDERQRLSCIIVTGDEIAHIRECLASVAFCDETIVVDSYSTDGTYDVCLEHATRVLRRHWTGYRDQKAFALEQARFPWVLNVDADERVSPELRAEIDHVLTSDGRGYDGFTIPRLVHYLGRWWHYGGWYPDRRLRLFRRERALWGGVDPHEHVELRGKAGWLHGPLWHYTYDDVADHVATIDRFTNIASGSSRTPARRESWSHLVLRPAARFVRFYVLRGGFCMGFPGLFAAISAAVYVHLKYAKRDERVRLARSER